MYNELWMKDRGMMHRERYGDLRDMVFRKYEDDEVISIEPGDSLQKAYLKLKENGISQLPVIENDRLAGIIAESDLLFALSDKRRAFGASVEEVMSRNIITIKASAPEEELLDILKKDYVALVETENGAFFGMITKIDYLTYLELNYFKS